MNQTPIRAFEPTDIEAAATLINTCVDADGVGQRLSPQMVRDWMSLPSIDAASDWFVAEADGQLVGLAMLFREPGTRLVYWLSIHPTWRDGTLGQRLVERCLNHARTQKEPVLDIPAGPVEVSKRRLLESLGFRHVRSWWRMRMDLGRALAQEQWPVGFTLRAFERGRDEHLLSDLVREIFADHWGEGEHSLEDIEHDVSLRHFDASLLLLLQSEGRTVGYIWSWVDPDLAEQTGDRVAFIGDLGIVASYRNRGLGRALLLHALRDLRARGLTAAELDVDGPNANAKHLYESVGFYEKEERCWYRKEVRRETGYGTPGE
ncbi:MAG: GNAT family N-acetyltransferase [Chloroflexi bacterium]|nr:GNAT family N-acetyltransferase [Chloroflexota bacterium]